MRISDWSSDVCSSDLTSRRKFSLLQGRLGLIPVDDDDVLAARGLLRRIAQQAQALQDIKQHGVAHGEAGRAAQIGRASCRERGWQSVSISVVAVSLKKKREKDKSEKRSNKQKT